MLLSIFSYGGGTCPKSGAKFSTYAAVGAADPDMNILFQYIVKRPTKGTISVPINFTLPSYAALPIAGCLGVILDGGGYERPIKMATELSIAYSTTLPPTGAYEVGLGGEFCFGQDWGCQAHSVDTTVQYVTTTPITQTSTLVALVGDVSDSPVGTAEAKPKAAWGATNDFYLLRGSCEPYTSAGGQAGPGAYLDNVPAGAMPLLGASLNGVGRESLQQSFYQPFSNLVVNAGDCIVTMFGRTGGGSTDDETQVHAVLAPLPVEHLQLSAAACTAKGDTNQDGVINAADELVLDQHLNQHVTGGAIDGDLNDDGVVDGSDYTLLDNILQPGVTIDCQ